MMHAGVGSSQDIPLLIFQNAPLRVGMLIIPDINTTAVQGVGASLVDSVVLNSTLLSHHGDVSSDFHFQAPVKRGRPKGSKSKKGTGKAGASDWRGVNQKWDRVERTLSQ